MFRIVTGEPIKQSAELTGEPVKIGRIRPISRTLAHWAHHDCERLDDEAHEETQMDEAMTDDADMGYIFSNQCQEACVVM